jgi:hypothetical protein
VPHKPAVTSANFGWLHLQRLLQPELAHRLNSPPEHLAAAHSPEACPRAPGKIPSEQGNFENSKEFR